MRKAQSTIFAIIGMVLIFSVLLSIVLVNQLKIHSITRGGMEQTTFSEDSQMLSNLRDICIEASVKKAVVLGSINPIPEAEDTLEEDINSRILRCFDQSFYTNRGYEITGEYPETQVKITEDTVYVSGNFKITMFDKESNKKSELSEFTYTFDKPKFTRLETDSEGIILKETNVISNDNQFVVHIPTGVSFTGDGGENLRNIEVKVMDKVEFSDTYHNSASSFVIGDTIYAVTDSVVNDGSVEVCINYETELLYGVSEDNLAVAWYDIERGVWYSVPSQVNKLSKTVCAQVTHFSPNALIDTYFDFESCTSFYEEHVHNPCGPAPVQNAKTPAPIKWDRRFQGILGRAKYETAIWQFNNYCLEIDDFGIDLKHNPGTRDFYDSFAEGSGMPPEPKAPHCGSVYPPFYEALLVRETQEGAGSTDSAGDFVKVSFPASSITLNPFKDNYEYYLISDPEVKVRQTDLNPVFESSGNQILSISPIDSAFRSVNDRWDLNSKVHIGDTELSDWKRVETLPNEHAERPKEDFDDDDAPEKDFFASINNDEWKCKAGDRLVPCFMCLVDLDGNGEIQGDERKWCRTLFDEADGNVKESDGSYGKLQSSVEFENLMQQCQIESTKIAKEKYEALRSSDPHMIEWGVPSGDGLLDYKWVGGSTIRNYAVCELTSNTEIGEEYHPTVQLTGDIIVVTKTITGLKGVKVGEEGIATPTTWGYGNQPVENIVSQPNYKLTETVSDNTYKTHSKDVGFAGAGNDDQPLTKYLYLDDDHSLCKNEIWFYVMCSQNDVCHIDFPNSKNPNLKFIEFCNGNKESCPPGVPTCTDIGGLILPYPQKPELLSCGIAIPQVLSQSDKNIPKEADKTNPIQGWVANTDESQEVCAFLDVCARPEKDCAGSNSRCPSHIVCTDMTCTDPNNCECPVGTTQTGNDVCCLDKDKNGVCDLLPHCGDGIIQPPAEKCDGDPDCTHDCIKIPKECSEFDECSVTKQCGPGTGICDLEKCECSPPAQCAQGSQCSAGVPCLLGTCDLTKCTCHIPILECTAQDECSAGKACSVGKCDFTTCKCSTVNQCTDGIPDGNGGCCKDLDNDKQCDTFQCKDGWIPSGIPGDCCKAKGNIHKCDCENNGIGNNDENRGPPLGSCGFKCEEPQENGKTVCCNKPTWELLGGHCPACNGPDDDNPACAHGCICDDWKACPAGDASKCSSGGGTCTCSDGTPCPGKNANSCHKPPTGGGGGNGNGNGGGIGTCATTCFAPKHCNPTGQCVGGGNDDTGKDSGETSCKATCQLPKHCNPQGHCVGGGNDNNDQSGFTDTTTTTDGPGNSDGLCPDGTPRPCN